MHTELAAGNTAAQTVTNVASFMASAINTVGQLMYLVMNVQTWLFDTVCRAVLCEIK